jgi:hypothetical protein
MKLKYLFFSLAFVACNKAHKENTLMPVTIDSVSNMDNDMFKKKVVIILSDSLRGDSSTINIQDYVVDGKSFIPVFTSMAEFDASTQGQVKEDKIEIDGILLLSILKGNETLKTNPGLESEKDYKADELIRKYSLEIADLNKQMKEKK